MELHPELQDCLVDTPVGTMLTHPLLHQLFWGTAMEVEWANRAFEEKKRLLEDAVTAGDWHTVVAVHERPYRPEVLLTVPTDVDDYWGLIAEWWMDTEFPHAQSDVWQELFDHPDAHLMMSAEERAVLARLPDRVTVWRGVTVEDDDGLSWTFSRSRAEWFSRRFATEGDVPQVLEREVDKSVITAYLRRRGEEEVIILPHHWD